MSSMIEPQLKYHVFSDKIMDTVVNFQVLKLKDSFYVWIGSSNKLGNVTVAMPTKFVSRFELLRYLVPTLFLGYTTARGSS